KLLLYTSVHNPAELAFPSPKRHNFLSAFIPQASSLKPSPGPAMLTIYGSQTYGGFCDRVARRDFLKIGGMALGGLALPDVLRLEAAQGERSHKAIINVFLPGGPPHIDMWDLKPDAPADIRGEYNPI